MGRAGRRLRWAERRSVWVVWVVRGAPRRIRRARWMGVPSVRVRRREMREGCDILR